MLKHYIYLNNKVHGSKKIIDEIDKITSKTYEDLNFLILIKFKIFIFCKKIVDKFLSLKSKEFKKYLFYTNQKKGKVYKEEILKIFNIYSKSLIKNNNFSYRQLSESIHIFKSQ